MCHGVGRRRPVADTHMQALRRHQSPQTVVRSRRQASQQPLHFARGPVCAGILRQSVLTAANSHYGPVCHGCGYPVAAQSGLSKVSSGGGASPCGKIIGNVHSANVPCRRPVGPTAAGICGKRLAEQTLTRPGRMDTGKAPRGRRAPHSCVGPRPCQPTNCAAEEHSAAGMLRDQLGKGMPPDNPGPAEGNLGTETPADQPGKGSEALKVPREGVSPGQETPVNQFTKPLDSMTKLS